MSVVAAADLIVSLREYAAADTLAVVAAVAVSDVANVLVDATTVVIDAVIAVVRAFL